LRYSGPQTLLNNSALSITIGGPEPRSSTVGWGNTTSPFFVARACQVDLVWPAIVASLRAVPSPTEDARTRSELLRAERFRINRRPPCGPLCPSLMRIQEDDRNGRALTRPAQHLQRHVGHHYVERTRSDVALPPGRLPREILRQLGRQPGACRSRPDHGCAHLRLPASLIRRCE
jgi:hypothetical protein